MVIQLHLSSELGPFEDKQLENPGSQRFRSGLSNAEDSLDTRKIPKSGGFSEFVFMGYLEAQWTVSVHNIILQFASTHQYCRTAKYGPNRITGDEDMSGYVFEPS